MKKLVALLLCLMMVVPATLASAETTEGKVLNIWCWNDEFQSRFNAYYPEVKEIAEDKSTTTLNDGTIVKWTINPNEGNNYQNKLDEALRAQESAAADDKIDIFLIEADYALKYVDSPYTLDVKADIGLTDEDLAGQYKYTQEIATSADDKLKAVTWQATPGLFAYRRSIAKDVLGTEDPDAVQEALADWDKFNAVAEQAAAKGYYMLSGYDDAYRTFSNNVSAPWVADDGETVVVDANLMKWVAQTKLYTVTVSVPSDVSGLLSGMFADVTFHTDTASGAIVVPTESILTSGSTQYVYVVQDDNTAKYIEVTTGLTGNGVTEVTSGLSAGQQLVTVGQSYLSDGAAVRVVSGED